MSGGPDAETEDAEDDEDALQDDDEDADADDDEDEDPEEDLDTLRQQAAEYNQLQRRLEYQAQQQRNQEYWGGIEAQADAAFDAKYAFIQREKHQRLDGDTYETEALATLNGEIKQWYREFYASQNDARARAQEKAAIPVYAARVATHFGLSAEQANDLLEYQPQQMVREAQKVARHNEQLRKYQKNQTQNTRSNAQQKLAGNPVRSGGSGRGAPTKVRAGSMNHLAAIFAAAKQGR